MVTTTSRPVLRIQQLEGSRRTLLLSGRAGPLVGASRLVRQRGEVTRPPGTDRGRALLLGGEDEPTTYEFKWRTRALLGTRDAVLEGATATAANAVRPIVGPIGVGAISGDAIEDADELVRIVDSMTREPSICAVSFAGLESVGFLREFEPVGDRAGEYFASLEIEWITPSLSRKPKPPAATGDPADTYNDMVDSWTEYMRTAIRPATMAADAVEAVELQLAAVNTNLRRSGAIALEFERAFTSVKSLKRSMAGALWAVGTAALGLRDTVQVGAADLAQTDEPTAVVQALRFRARTQAQAARFERQNAIESYRLADEADPEILGVYTAVEGEDLRYIALRTYGDVSVWEDLADFNRLTGTRLSAGQRVKLPQIAALG